MRLFELFTSKHKIRRTYNVKGLPWGFFDGAVVYKIKIDDTMFVFYIQESRTNKYDFGFGEAVMYADGSYSGNVSYYLNPMNAKASFKVYSIAIDIIRKFVMKTNPLDKLSITGYEPKQSKLYLSMMKKLQSQLPKNCGIFYNNRGLFITKNTEYYLSLSDPDYKYLPPIGAKI